MCIVVLASFEDVGNNVYMNFFFGRPLNIKTQQRYIDIILLGIFRSSEANIHINKCYFAKSYSAKCCKEKIQNILGIDFLCVKINLSHKQSHRVTDDLWCITYYIIYTLTRIENVLIYDIIHAYMHWP